MSAVKLTPGPAAAVLQECRSPSPTPSPQEPWPCQVITGLCLIPTGLAGPDPDKQPWAGFPWCETMDLPYPEGLGSWQSLMALPRQSCLGPAGLRPWGPPGPCVRPPCAGRRRPYTRAFASGRPGAPGLGSAPGPAEGLPGHRLSPGTESSPRSATGSLSSHRPPAAPQPLPTAPCGRASWAEAAAGAGRAGRAGCTAPLPASLGRRSLRPRLFLHRAQKEERELNDGCGFWSCEQPPGLDGNLRSRNQGGMAASLTASRRH